MEIFVLGNYVVSPKSRETVSGNWGNRSGKRGSVWGKDDHGLQKQECQKRRCKDVLQRSGKFDKNHFMMFSYIIKYVWDSPFFLFYKSNTPVSK